MQGIFILKWEIELNYDLINSIYFCHLCHATILFPKCVRIWDIIFQIPFLIVAERFGLSLIKLFLSSNAAASYLSSYLKTGKGFVGGFVFLIII